MAITILFIVFAYCLGSVSTAILISKLMKLPDPRQHGSGNAGATNVLRTGKKTAALFVLLGDLLKGTVAILIAKSMHLEDWALSLIAVAVVLGHVFPVFFKFKGGKGVATMLGVFLGLSWVLALWAAVIWFAVALISKYSSLASLATAIGCAYISCFLLPLSESLGLLFIALLVIYQHRGNIKRLGNRTEDKLSFFKK